MTSEILIMTKKTIIMGADSAVTINNKKTHTGANKLFELSNNPPMGIMIFGSADFDSFALETLIEDYKNQTNFEELEDIMRIKESFLAYLNNIPYQITDFEDKLLLFKENLLNKLKHYSKDNLVKYLNGYKNNKMLPFLEKNSLDIEFEDIIMKLNNIQVDIKTLKKYFSEILLDSSTGIVIAGFNKNDLRPSYISFNLITKYNNEIIISNVNSNIDCKRNLIIHFAQNDVINTFISGIDDEFKLLLEHNVNYYIKIHSMELIEHLIEKEQIDKQSAYNELNT